MKARTLTSRENAFLKTIRLVSSQRRSAPADLVVCEGLRGLEEATHSGFAIAGALLSDSFGATGRERELEREWERNGVVLYRCPAALFRQFSGLSSPQGALALVVVPAMRLDSLVLPPDPLLVCACGLQDPGNMGTIVRTAAAAGAAALISIIGTASARNPKAIRASAGAFFRLPIIEQLSAGAFMDFCRGESVTIYRTHPRIGIGYLDAPLGRAGALVFGNESSGLEGKEWDSLPCLRIPMAGCVESLNVGAAAAVLLFEACRQRQGNPRGNQGPGRGAADRA